MSQDSIAPEEAPEWRGFHHIALVTPDLDATIEFYCDVLGMKVLFTMPATEINGRHVAILPGEGHLGLHFFEQPDAELFIPPDLKTLYWLPGALHHISFALPDRAAGLAFRKRLETHGVAMTEIMLQADMVYNMLFQDNNGMLLEAAWPKDADETY